MLIHDGVLSIQNGFEAAFGVKDNRMCWAHMRRKIVENMLETWSLAYVTGEKEFHNSPEIELSQWTSAYAWAKRNVAMKVVY